MPRKYRRRDDERSGRDPSGSRPLPSERERFFALLRQGWSVDRASQEVGINGRTGRDWRSGVRKLRDGSRVYPDQHPMFGTDARLGQRHVVAGSLPVLSARFLSEDERLRIADLHQARQSVRAIARELGRSASTVSRELRRNANTRGEYRPHQAHRRAWQRRRRPKQRKLTYNVVLHALVQQLLRERAWSPEQISAWLRRQHPHDPAMQVSHETIYQALYLQGRGELRRELARALRTGRAVRKRRRQPDQRRSRFVDPMVMISERPAEVGDRAVPGHWEGDLILGAAGASAVGTLVERTTRFVMLLHLPEDHTAERVRDALIATMTELPEHLRRSLTWDQGCELARHRDITIAADLPVYFCDPASPWQRGSNENTNGLLRQFLPKGTDLSLHTPEQLAHIAELLNTRPRKTLGWQTPAQRFAALLDQAA